MRKTTTMWHNKKQTKNEYIMMYGKNMEYGCCLSNCFEPELFSQNIFCPNDCQWMYLESIKSFQNCKNKYKVHNCPMFAEKKQNYSTTSNEKNVLD